MPASPFSPQALHDRLARALTGRYVIDHAIGKGGMAMVFRATRVVDQRAVAVKLLLPDLEDSLGGGRFLREIALEQALDHPGIIGVLDSGEAEGLPYYVMPFVEGESLRQRLDREKQLPLDDVLRIMRQVGDAVAHAHARGIVHRDLKPDNVLLTGPQVTVADFGVARAITQAGGERLTKTGMIVGTPQYMAPEQAGNASTTPPTAASDQYALACMVYEMLAGQEPFAGPTMVALLAKHAMAPPPSLRIVRPDLPSYVEAAIHRGLAKDPHRRFPDVTAFVKGLDGAAPAVETANPSTRARGCASKAAAAVLLLLGSVGVMLR